MTPPPGAMVPAVQPVGFRVDDSRGLTGPEVIHFVSCDAIDAAGYYRTRTSRRLHRVKAVRVLWSGVDASYRRPRIVVELVCRSMPPSRPIADGLEVWPLWLNPCPKCFPLGDADPHRPPKVRIRVTMPSYTGTAAGLVAAAS